MRLVRIIIICILLANYCSQLTVSPTCSYILNYNRGGEGGGIYQLSWTSLLLVLVRMLLHSLIQEYALTLTVAVATVDSLTTPRTILSPAPPSPLPPPVSAFNSLVLSTLLVATDSLLFPLLSLASEP